MAQNRRMVDWESTSNLVQTQSLNTTVVNRKVLLAAGQIQDLGARVTLTRMELDLSLALLVAGTVVVHAAVVVENLDAAGNALNFDPTSDLDLERKGLLWRMSWALQTTATIDVDRRQHHISIRSQRKLVDHQQVAFLIEPNGGTIEFLINGRTLCKLA